MWILERHPWPGNVRELRHALDYAVIHCRDRVIRPGDLPPEVLDISPAADARALPGGDTVEDERARIVAALAQARGNRTKAAKLLNVSRATFYRRLTELGLSPE